MKPMVSNADVLVLFDGAINSRRPNLEVSLTLSTVTPAFILLSAFHIVWLPCYAAARFSDLSWGNRDSGGEDHSSEIAKQRASTGKTITGTIILTNVAATIGAIVFKALIAKLLQIAILIFLGVMAMFLPIAVMDVIFRFCKKSYGGVKATVEHVKQHKDVPGDRTTRTDTMSMDMSFVSGLELPGNDLELSPSRLEEVEAEVDEELSSTRAATCRPRRGVIHFPPPCDPSDIESNRQSVEVPRAGGIADGGKHGPPPASGISSESVEDPRRKKCLSQLLAELREVRSGTS